MLVLTRSNIILLLFLLSLPTGNIALALSGGLPTYITVARHTTLFPNPGLDSYKDCPGALPCGNRWPNAGEVFQVVDTTIKNSKLYYCLADAPSEITDDMAPPECRYWIPASSSAIRPSTRSECPRTAPVVTKAKPIEAIIESLGCKGSACLEYESCKNSPSGFEETFAPVAKQSFENGIDPLCTLEAMKIDQKAQDKYCRGNQVVTVRYYDSERQKMVRTGEPEFDHCIGPNYHKAMHNTLITMTTCFGMDPKEALSLFTAESGFNINKISATGASGATQIVGSWISDFNNNYRKAFLETLNQSNRPECKQLYEDLSKESISPGNDCSATNPPKNPKQNMFYGIAHMILSEQVSAETLYPYAIRVGMTQPSPSIVAAENRQKEIAALTRELNISAKRQKTQAAVKQIRQEIQQLQAEANRIKNKDLPRLYREAVLQDRDLKLILKEVAVYAHNYGAQGARGYLRGFLSTLKKPITFEQFTGKTGQFSNYLSARIPNLGLGPSRTSEMLNYMYILKPNGPKGSQSSVTRKTNMFEDRVRSKLGVGDEERVCTTY